MRCAEAIASPLDTLVRAEAPEGIFLELSPAGVSARAYAFLIDLGIRAALLFVASTVLGVAGALGYGVFLIVVFLIEWFYPVVFELGLRGATPGKRAMGIKVVMDSGLPVTPAASMLRNLLRSADFLPFLFAGAAICMLLRPDFKRLGDLAAGTRVVYERGHRALQAMVLPPARPQPPAQVQSADQQAALLELASRARRLTPERVEELAQLAQPALAVAQPQAAAPRLFSVAQWLYGKR